MMKRRKKTQLTHTGPRVGIIRWSVDRNSCINIILFGTRSMVYNGTGYKGNFGPSTEALFSE